MVEEGTSVVEAAFFNKRYFEEWYSTIEAKVYRSKGKKDLTRSLFASYMINKKWTLQEEFANHLIMFQQVTEESEFLLFHYILTFQAGLTIIEVGYTEEQPDDDPMPLKMEHFYFPLGMWLVGILLSAVFLLAEIIIHRLRKPETKVAIAKLEEPTVTQSTPPESENLEEMVLKKWRAVRLSDTEGAELDLAVSENI